MRALPIQGAAAAAVLLSCINISLFAGDDKKPAPKAAPPKTSAAPKAAPAAAGAPGRAGAPASTAGRSGATTANPGGARGGATTTNPGGARGGATTANPGGARGGVSTANPGGIRGPAVNAGGRPAGPERGPAAGGMRGAAPGREVHVAGGTAHLGARGEVRDAHVRGMDIHRAPNGSRRIVAERADHSRVFAERGGRGYVQRPYMYHGREFASRTYYVNGRAYNRYYNRYAYRGVYLEVYAPPRYYAAPFYGWAYNPWAAPVPYAWGWAGNPWAVYYGGYFAPYPVYPNASFWLTDYMISTSLAAAYQAQVEAAAGAAPPPPTGPPAALTPDVKQLVADEVQRQLALENAEAAQNARNADPDPQSSGIARMLTDNTPHVFIASGDLGLTDAAGQECSISQGDVLQMVSPPQGAETAAPLVVMATKAQDCRKGDTVSVQLTDLQEMQNHMRETIDQGLGEIQTKAGQGGLPALPAAAKAAPATAAFAAAAPPPDPNVAAEIEQQVQAADAAEREVTAGSGGPSADGGSAPMAPPPPSPPAAAPVEEDLGGKTIDQVVAIKGQPKSISKLGAKTIYVYDGTKIIFTNGKVTDIQ